MIPYLDLKKVNDAHGVEIENAVKRVLESGWYLLGDENREFEKSYASYIGTEFAVGCANGLDALTLIFRAAIELGRMKPGDEVIVPANTYIASILAVSENGLVPVPVEPDPCTFQINPELIERAITPRTKAVMEVHLYGRCAHTQAVEDICRRYSLMLVEDNAQAHGCMWQRRRTGSLGHAAGHSFYPGKNLGALGDGGAVTTSDPALAKMVRILANYGSEKKYVFEYAGRNSRLDEIQAAVLSAKLPHLDDDNALRRYVAAQYLSGIVNEHVKLPVPPSDPMENVWHIFPILSPLRDKLQRHLSGHGVNTMIHYPVPPHLQGAYSRWNNRSYPVTEMIHQQELSLPLSPVMTPGEVGFVIETVNSFKP